MKLKNSMKRTSGPGSKRWEKTKLQGVLRLVKTKVLYARFSVEGRKWPVWRSLETESLEVAQTKLALVRAAVRGTSGMEGMLLSECADVFLTRVRSFGLLPLALTFRESTVAMLRACWPDFESMPAALVTPWMCSMWADGQRKKYSATRFNGMLDSLRGILDIAVEAGALSKDIVLANGGVTRNPARTVARAGSRVKARQLPDAKTFARILTALTKCRERRRCWLYIQVVAYTGLRPPSEVARVRPEDVDLKKGMLLVRGSKDSGDQLVPMTPQAIELFSKYWSEIFKVVKMKPQKGLSIVCAELNIPHLRLYDLRHLFATRMLQSGADVRTVADLMRHKDRGKTLLSTYAQVNAAHSREAVAKVKF